MHRIIWFFMTGIIFLSVLGSSQAQNLSFGFKAGLSNVSVDGPLESSSDGMQLESIKPNRAFILALLLNVNFTDELLLQTEFMYNQKGYNYSYEGPSYAILRTQDQKYVFSSKRNMSLNVSNTYFQIPVSLSYKFFNRLQVQAGVYGNVLVSSTGAGRVIYSDLSDVIGEVEQTLNYNYRSNDPGGASPVDQQIIINNEPELIASQVNAYYDYEEKDKSQFRTFDAGAHVGVNLFINQSLFVGARYSRGFMDITRNTVDHSFQSLDQGKLRFSDDDDRYKAWEFTIGFSF